MNQPLRLEYVDPSTLGPNPRNWRVHGEAQRATFEGCLAEVGWADALLFNERTGRLLDGHMRREQAIANRLDAVPVLVGSWDEATEAKILATKDNLGAMAQVDPAAWDGLLREIDTGCPELMAMLAECSEDFGVIPTDRQVRKDARDQFPADGDPGDGDFPAGPPPAIQEDARPVDLGVPDVVFASDNEWDVPTLDLGYQADAPDFPITLWGSIGHGREMTGTYLFYVDDRKFVGLWKDPGVLLKSGCRNIVELNYSTHPQVPRHEILHRTARKRWISRWAQSKGIRIFVDINVDPSADEINLLGVPRGWRSWATRSHASAADFDGQFERARSHAGSRDIVFLVYGGGIAVKKLCAERGWYWAPEQSDVARGKVPSDG